MKKDANKSPNAAKLRRQTELELLKLKTAVEQAAEGFAIADLNGYIQFVNAAWAKMHGYTVKELIGKHLGIFHTKEQLRKEVIPFNKKAMKNGMHEGEVGHRRRDGTTFPTLMTSTVIKDENRNPIAFAGMAHDITERKRVEQALRESRLHLNEAQRLAKVGSWSWIVEADIVTWSDELYAINRRNPKLPAVRYTKQFRLYTPESWARLDNAVRHTLATGKPYELELEIIRQDGAHYWGLARGEAIRDNTGRVIQLHGTIQDITERKQAEATEAIRASMQFAQSTLDALTTYILSLIHI